MAVRLAGSSSNYLSIAHTWGTTGTVCFWYLRNSTTSPYSTIMDLGGTNQILYDWDGTDKLSYYDNGSDFQGSALGTNTWHHIAVVRTSATAGTVYLNGASDFTMTSVGTWGNLRIGSNVTWGEPGNMTMFAFKAWDAALSLAEIQQERYAIFPARLDNMWLFAPMFDGATERLLNYLGTGNFSQTGTLSDVAGPPVGYGNFGVVPQVAAGGGTSYDNSISMGITSAIADSGAVAAIGGITMSQGLSVSQPGTLSAKASISPGVVSSVAAAALHASQVSFQAGLTHAAETGAIAVQAVSIALSNSFTVVVAGSLAGTTYSGSITVDLTHAVAGAGSMDALANISLAESFTAALTALLDAEASISAGVAAALTSAATAALQASFSAAVAGGVTVTAVIYNVNLAPPNSRVLTVRAETWLSADGTPRTVTVVDDGRSISSD